MKRREFIRLISGTAVAWPFAVQAQQSDRMRRIGVLGADEPDNKDRVAAFVSTLRELGWTDGRNVQIVYRWGGGSAAVKGASELATLAPDAILSVGSDGTGPMLRATRTVPVVFVIVPDPVGAGFVKGLSRPGGNATGFMMFEYNLCGKWLELLKQIAPHVTRAAVLRDPTLEAGVGQFAVIQSVAPSIGIEVSPINLTNAAEIESEVATFAGFANGGLILTASALSLRYRALIIALAARHKLPAVYQEHGYVAAGGLVSYGPNFIDQYRRAASYVDRILKGEKPTDMPVQAPTKYELAINLKTAKGLDLIVPASVLARADEVIE